MAWEADPVGSSDKTNADGISKPQKTASASSQAQDELLRRTAALNLKPNTKTPGTGVSNAVFRPDAERKRYVQVQSPAQAQPQPQRVPAPKQTPGAGRPLDQSPRAKSSSPMSSSGKRRRLRGSNGGRHSGPWQELPAGLPLPLAPKCWLRQEPFSWRPPCLRDRNR